MTFYLRHKIGHVWKALQMKGMGWGIGGRNVVLREEMGGWGRNGVVLGTGYWVLGFTESLDIGH